MDETSENAKGHVIRLTLPPDLAEALDRYIAERQPALSRSEALLRAFREWARERGLADGGSGLRPEELNAANDD